MEAISFQIKTCLNLLYFPLQTWHLGHTITLSALVVMFRANESTNCLRTVTEVQTAVGSISQTKRYVAINYRSIYCVYANVDNPFGSWGVSKPVTHWICFYHLWNILWTAMLVMYWRWLSSRLLLYEHFSKIKITRNLVRFIKECRLMFVAFRLPVGFMPIAPEYGILFFIRTRPMSPPRCTCSRRCFQGCASLRCDTAWQLQKEMWRVLPS